MDKQTQKNLLEMVKKNYDEVAEEFSESRRKEIWPELVRLSEPIKEGDRVLDVGCGNGRLLDALRKKQIVYLGLDSSKKLIHNAQALHIGYNFREGDILDLNHVPEFDFDYVFCVATLQHLPGRALQIDALKQLKNKVKNSGRIIITVWNLWGRELNRKKPYKKWIWKFWFLKIIKKNRMDFGDIIFDRKNSQGERVSQRYYHAFRKGELKTIFKKAGLKIEKLYKDQYNYYAVLKK